METFLLVRCLFSIVISMFQVPLIVSIVHCFTLYVAFQSQIFIFFILLIVVVFTPTRRYIASIQLNSPPALRPPSRRPHPLARVQLVGLEEHLSMVCLQLPVLLEHRHRPLVLCLVWVVLWLLQFIS